MSQAKLPNRLIDGDASFLRGINSVNPLDAAPGFYTRSINMLNRGGVLQTRPGFRWVGTLPDGPLQGMATLIPLSGAPELVVAVAGRVYRSLLPYRDNFERVEGIQFLPTAEKVYFTQATRSVRRNDDGSISFIKPVNTLMMQDGGTAPGYYDGKASGHLLGAKTTPLGTVMAWTGDRLWVADGNRIFVSDINDPYSFVEDVYNNLGGRQYFTVEGEIVGMAETPGLLDPQLLVFTKVKTVGFRANVRDRASWATLPDFQRTIFTIGCVSHRSITTAHGQLFWMTPFGYVSLDSAVLTRTTSTLGLLDNEMAFSKARLNGDLTSVAAANFENFLLISVPHASPVDFLEQKPDLNPIDGQAYLGSDTGTAFPINEHTWVLDFTVKDLLNEQQPKAWASVWTGVRPVEWAGGVFLGVPRLFCVSKDGDGHNRVWEAFAPDRRDEFCDIDWAFETRAYTAGTLTQKEFRFAELMLSVVQGEVDISVSWAGAKKGRWREIANARVMANEGNVTTGVLLPARLFALKRQIRLFRTQDARDIAPGALSGCDVEGTRKENRDVGFQLCVRGNGPCAVDAIRVFLDQVNEDNDAQCLQDESPGHYVRFDGAASTDPAELQADAACTTCGSWTGTATVTESYHTTTVTVTATAQSNISQAAADKLALQRAWAQANIELDKLATPYIGGNPTPILSQFAFSLDFEFGENSGYVPTLF